MIKEARAASEPEALITALRELGLPLERIGLEACSLTAWLHDGLRDAGLPAICIETRQANAAMKTMLKAGLYPKRFTGLQISYAVKLQLKDAVGAALTFTGSGLSGVVREYAAGIAQSFETY